MRAARSDEARWTLWLKGVRKQGAVEFLFVEPLDDDTESTTPMAPEDVHEGSPPPTGVVVYAKVAGRPDPFVFHPSPVANSGKGALGNPELRAILKAAQEGQSRYIELVQPTLVMYRDENTRLHEQVHDLQAQVRALQAELAAANAKTADERMDERRQAKIDEVVHQHLLPRLERVLKAIEGNASIAAIATDLGVLMGGVPEEVRAQIIAVDPQRAFRVLGALEAAAGSR